MKLKENEDYARELKHVLDGLRITMLPGQEDGLTASYAQLDRDRAHNRLNLDFEVEPAFMFSPSRTIASVGPGK